MASVKTLSAQQLTYDYVIVGGGTAGCVIAGRLADQLPDKRILLIEAGPSDWKDDRILDLRNMYNLMGSEFDYGYKSTEQPFGNSDILHSRAKVLGGCSSHNGSIAMHPLEYDCRKWVEAGAAGWSFDTFKRLIRKLRTDINDIHERHRNPIVEDFIEAAAKATRVPPVKNFVRETATGSGLHGGGVGYVPLTYNPDNGQRISASVAYIHPIIGGEVQRPNLTVLTDAWVSRINTTNHVATGVNLTFESNKSATINAKVDLVLCAGAIDTPRLMMLSGLGPRDHLQSLGIPVVQDLPGVGENLMDHPETIITWELHAPLPDRTVMWADAAILARREPPNAAGDDGITPDAMMHIYTMPFQGHTKDMDYDQPDNVFSLTPNVPRSRARGRISLKSADPKEHPAIDFRYYTDPEGYDEATMVWSLKQARKIVKEAPLKNWIKREVCPGVHIQSDKDLGEFARKAGNTVYHPCGTTKIADLSQDPMGVVSPELKVKGIRNLRIADAGVFPLITTINPMLTVLAVGERAAELIVEDAKIRPSL
ncbi:hypothetical protein EDB80DRAFT_608906 [Ilyonectria destructans]|nr:hypothetical protein EDB80DRAFT_608906 [Ilyonectria destructans]